MNKQPTFSKPEDAVNTLRSEMITSILKEDVSYPWNSDALESEDNFALCECLDADELDLGVQKLFSHLNECWRNADTSPVKQYLWERFGQFVPSHQLDRITTYAQEIISVNLSPLEQLIKCVKPLLSNWSEDDLQIFARPLVYAMRGTTEFKQAPWDELSEIDQVRMTMKIAQEAIHQFHTQNSQIISELDG